ncbi:MAG: N-6 DNA methylase [Myxococcales bacterium]|nr:N-6 DNA methylase [Myxococcales bacterium]
MLSRRERVLYRQIHPLKLAVDVTGGFVSTWLVWRHALVAALLVGFPPSVIASAWMLGSMDFTRQRDSTFGRYVAYHMRVKLKLDENIPASAAPRLAALGLDVDTGIDADLGKEHADSFHRDQHPDLKADFVLANPPFNDSDWGGERLRDDVRWKYGVPPVGNANFAWVQHFVHHLAPRGTAGFVLANGSMSSNQSGEGEIRSSSSCGTCG